jgi:hypothetical protein
MRRDRCIIRHSLRPSPVERDVLGGIQRVLEVEADRVVTGGVDSECREVQSDDRGTALCKLQAVGAEMTLQVQDAAAIDGPESTSSMALKRLCPARSLVRS